MNFIFPRVWTFHFRYVATVLFLLTGVGCASFPKPTAHVVGVRLSDLKLDSASVVFDVAIDNPYATQLPLANFDYTLASGGTPFLNRQRADPGNGARQRVGDGGRCQPRSISRRSSRPSRTFGRGR